MSPHKRGETSSALIHAAIAGRHAQDVVAELRERGVNVGAPLRGYGSRDPRERHIESAVRFSPHYYNTDSEIDDAVAHLRDVLRHDDARVGVQHRPVRSKKSRAARGQ